MFIDKKETACQVKTSSRKGIMRNTLKIQARLREHNLVAVWEKNKQEFKDVNGWNPSDSDVLSVVLNKLMKLEDKEELWIKLNKLKQEIRSDYKNNLKRDEDFKD